MSVPTINGKNESLGSVRVISGSGFRYVIPFPWRLHQMLSEVMDNGEREVVSWLDDGRSFQVRIPERFMKEVVPRFFKEKSFRSFQRQLYLYGFQRKSEAPHKGAYYHEKFVRFDRQRSLEILRVKAPKPRVYIKDAAPRQVSVGHCQAFHCNQYTGPILPSEGRSEQSEDSPITRRMPTHDSPGKFAMVQALPDCLEFPLQELPLHQVSPHREDCLSKVTSKTETTEWLVYAGVPVAALEPVAIRPFQDSASALHGCADDITRLFGSMNSGRSYLPTPGM